MRFLFVVLSSIILISCASAPKFDPGPVTDYSAKLDMSPITPTNRASALPKDWYKKAVFMEIYVRGYRDSDKNGRGDFNGLIEKLDYLQNLGITGIWLMPMMDSQDDDHGYAVKDYRATETAYGTMEEFKTLLDEAHKRGIGIIIDYVINHSAALNPLFKDSRHPQSDKRDWYIWSDTNKLWPRWDRQNTWHKANTGYYYGIFWNQMPDFNLTNEAVMQFHENNLRFWLEMGVDGFRFDAVGHLIENGVGKLTSQPENHAILQRLMSVINEYDNRYMVCEDPNDSLRVGRKDSCGSAFNFGLHKELIRTARSGKASNQLTSSIQSIPHNEMAVILANHDSFAGDRIIRQMAGDLNKYKMAAALLLTVPGIPFIYYGEEIGLGHTKGGVGDHALRSPMSWNGNPDNGGFTEARRFFRPLADNVEAFNVADQLEDPDSLYNFYRSIIQMRNKTPALQTGSFENISQGTPNLYSFIRDNGDQQAFVVMNLGDTASQATLPKEGEPWRLSFSSANSTHSGNAFTADPYSVTVFTR